MILVWFPCRYAYPMLWTVYVGLIEQPMNTVQSLAVEKIIYHSRYRPKGLDYDIALMKLVQPLIFNGIFSKRSSFKLESGSFDEPRGVTFLWASFCNSWQLCKWTLNLILMTCNNLPCSCFAFIVTNGLFVRWVSPFFLGFVEPICLPNFGEEFEDGKMCWISGWGAMIDGGKCGKLMLLLYICYRSRVWCRCVFPFLLFIQYVKVLYKAVPSMVQSPVWGNFLKIALRTFLVL